MNERRRREGRGRRTIKGRTSRKKEAENSFKEARDEEGSTRREETRGERRRRRYTAHPHLFCTDLSHTRNFIRNPKNTNPTFAFSPSFFPLLTGPVTWGMTEDYLARQYVDATEVTICEESKKSTNDSFRRYSFPDAVERFVEACALGSGRSSGLARTEATITDHGIVRRETAKRTLQTKQRMDKQGMKRYNQCIS